MEAIAHNFTAWYNTIQDSWVNESKCDGPSPGPSPSPVPFPPSGSYKPSDACTFFEGKALEGLDLAHGSVPSADHCCGACSAVKGCAASDFVEASRMRPTWEGVATGGTCHLKRAFLPKAERKGEIQTAMKQPPS